ncbi:aminotransferase-like domain-containing protein [Pyrobaculum calidifontis]|uniref:2-aminoadipate aminotransferase apoenzyme n=1 Tax=Pyrobaculum calidifontis (strain DSM 21063 / JCM 11548 / VA1) TaxID=410359 RepID=A3MWQ9_PYRCJ|nr:PLP-dependent aminotransferase family protein [Pyrobaculum calidifontis]ABO09076.1 2-aminoadipate aminotransferase apoenzyme [Pyrobaculum calidifontis JCM 11548]
MDIGKLLAERTKYMTASEIRELLKWATVDVISFGGGMPDPSTFPVEDIQKIVNYVLEAYPHKALQYGSTEGVYELRQEIAKFSEEHHGIKTKAENVLVTVGSQEALELLGRVFINPGDVVITENPTYLAALQAWRVYQPKLVGIPMDEHGMIVELLEDKVRELLARGERIKFIYTIPTAQNPTGITMTQDRRKYLLEVAERYDLLIVEDDPYSYFLFEPIQVAPIKALDKSDRVIYLSTASKIFAPGFRLGWVVASEEVIKWFYLAKQSLNLNTSNFVQYIFLEGLRRGVVTKNLPRVKELYKRKRDAMLAALETYMPEGVRWTRPSGGMFVWATVPPQIDTRELLRKAVTQYKVAFIPGHGFFVDESVKNAMRLNFTYPSFEQINEGIRRLALAIKEA